MNERIRELAEQAGLDYDSYDRYGLFNEEKFAELIVRECADWINDNVGMVDADARVDLLKHFGVK